MEKEGGDMARKTLILLLVVALFGWAGNAMALSITIDDHYIGAAPTSSSYYGKDIIGDYNKFEISKAVVTKSDTQLTVDVYTTYLYDDIGYLGTALGDLFLSSDLYTPWNPSRDDQESNGEDWEYALVLDDHSPDIDSVTSGNITLYDVSGGSIVLSSVSNSNYIYRAGQEVQFQAGSGQQALGTGTWEILGLGTTDDTDDYLRFQIDLTGFGGDELYALHYAPTCANDVIEGSIPDATTLLLLGSAMLIGALFIRRRRYQL